MFKDTPDGETNFCEACEISIRSPLSKRPPHTCAIESRDVIMEQPTRGWIAAFDELLSHYKRGGEGENSTVNNMRRKPNSALEQEIKDFIAIQKRQSLEEGLKTGYEDGLRTAREKLIALRDLFPNQGTDVYAHYPIPQMNQVLGQADVMVEVEKIIKEIQE